MKPIGLLMREHRTIERMIALLKVELQRIGGSRKVDPVFIATAVDFFRTYADRTHHGKEEDILFKALESKKLTPELQRIMAELVAEHMLARKTVTALEAAAEAYHAGSSGAVNDVLKKIGELVALYPGHIEKEDKHFFYPVQEYFSRAEQDAMLQAFWEFDRNMIHEKYTKVIEKMAARQS